MFTRSGCDSPLGPVARPLIVAVDEADVVEIDEDEVDADDEVADDVEGADEVDVTDGRRWPGVSGKGDLALTQEAAP